MKIYVAGVLDVIEDKISEMKDKGLIPYRVDLCPEEYARLVEDILRKVHWKFLSSASTESSLKNSIRVEYKGVEIVKNLEVSPTLIGQQYLHDVVVLETKE